jgi:hypothetical protein
MTWNTRTHHRLAVSSRTGGRRFESRSSSPTIRYQQLKNKPAAPLQMLLGCSQSHNNVKTLNVGPGLRPERQTQHAQCLSDLATDG